MAWALALQDTVLSEARARAVGALEAADAVDADRWLSVCGELAPGDAECGRVEDWLDIRDRSTESLQEGSAAEAMADPQVREAYFGSREVEEVMSHA